MQTPQTNQTNKQITSKAKYLIFVKSGLLQYNTTNKGSRPEILDDPGERRGEKKRVDDLQHHRQGTLLHVERRTRVEINFRRETATSENETIGRSRGRTIVESDDQGKHSH